MRRKIVPIGRSKSGSAWAILLFSSACFSFSTGAASASSVDADAQTLGAVVITGKMQSPALWTASRGIKKVYILGTPQTLPENLTWNFTDIDQRISSSEVVLGPRGLIVGDNIGIFRGLTLWPSIRGTKRNPEGHSLRDVLAPDVYARWREEKAKYLDDNDAERLRPLYAAFELFEAATKKAGLTSGASVDAMVAKTARKYRVATYDVRFRLSIKDPADAVARFDIAAAEDARCLEQTLGQLEEFLSAAVEVGNAWAAGDIGRMQASGANGATFTACWARLTNDAIAKQQGIGDLHSRVEAAWLEGLHSALRDHDKVFATLPVRDLTNPNGILAVLQREGFELVSPEPTDVADGPPEGT